MTKYDLLRERINNAIKAVGTDEFIEKKSSLDSLVAVMEFMEEERENELMGAIDGLSELDELIPVKSWIMELS